MRTLKYLNWFEAACHESGTADGSSDAGGMTEGVDVSPGPTGAGVAVDSPTAQDDFGNVDPGTPDEMGFADPSAMFGGPLGFGPSLTDVEPGQDVSVPSPQTSIGNQVSQSFMDKSLGITDPIFGQPVTVGRGLMGLATMAHPALSVVGLIGQGLNALDATSSTNQDPGQPGGGPASDDTPVVAETILPTPAPAPKPFRLGDVPMPGFLNLSPAMSNLQRRAAIATGGVSGTGAYTSPDARRYYASLLEQDRPDIGSLLPVERQYASRLGISSYPNTQKLLEAIAAV